MSVKSVAVFCGYSFGASPIFKEHATRLGKFLGQKGITLVYGGANGGLMGTLADSALEAGGKVIGVMPEGVFLKEQEYTGLTEMIRTPNLDERKKVMFQRSDIALALPGGYGTINEILELLCWNVYGLIDKKIFLLNTNNYFAGLIQQFETCGKEQFLSGELARDKIIVINEPEELAKYIT